MICDRGCDCLAREDAGSIGAKAGAGRQDSGRRIYDGGAHVPVQKGDVETAQAGSVTQTLIDLLSMPSHDLSNESGSIARSGNSAYHAPVRAKDHGPETRTITTNPPSSDLPAELLARCALGDRDAFSRLYGETSGKLYGVAMHILRDSRAEEVVQDAYVRIWHRAADYRPDKGSAMAWMSSIVRHRALDVLRRPAIETSVDDQDVWEGDAPGPLEATMQRAEARALARCLEQLEASQRQVMMLAFFHGLAHAELASRVKQPLGTVKSWIRRGLQRLKGCLES